MGGRSTKTAATPSLAIAERILIARGHRVLLDRDLAELYEVETKVLVQAVKRNLDRFPSDFMFQLTNQEFANLRSQSVTSSWGGRRYAPYAFTEQGVAMLSSIPQESACHSREHRDHESVCAPTRDHQAALMLALRHVAMAHGGIAAVARRAKLTREAAYRILSKSGNPELRSLFAILAAAGLKLSVKPIAKPSSVSQKRADYRVSRARRAPR